MVYLKALDQALGTFFFSLKGLLTRWGQSNSMSVQSCSFCGRSYLEVEHLLAGPDNIFICNLCVGRCVLKIRAAEPFTNKVFVVHGHDDAMKEAVARTIEKFKLEPVILQERPNNGKTIIEKFTEYSNVSFAVVLLSPDDIAYLKSSSAKNSNPRARQNVIFELGFFLGKLGRENVAVLYREGVEIPSDYQGVAYTPYDSHGSWKYALMKELKARGYTIDANILFTN